MSHRRLLVLAIVVILLLLQSAGTPAMGAKHSPATPPQEIEMLARFWQEAYGNPQAQPFAPQAVSGLADLLGKAEPDEDYNGVGQPYLPGPPFDHQPKVNQGYAWGMTRAGDKVWIGTGANAICTMFGSYGTDIISDTLTLETDSFVCEFGQSQYDPLLAPMLGDWRPPDAFLYDVEDDVFAEVEIPHPLLTSTLVLRSAGSHDGVTILGGPAFSESGEVSGINLFAFDAGTGDLIDGANLPQYTNIRKWVVVDDVMYTAVGNTDGGGSVLRWSGDALDPFQFEVVGHLDNEGAELVEHEGRLFSITWTAMSEGNFGSGEQAEVYMSPLIPPTGLTSADAGGWVKVWEVTDYEPDAITAETYLGGAMASFDGHLYWGTINFPATGALAHIEVQGWTTPFSIVAAMLGAHRSTTLFRGRDFGTPEQEIELLYGAAELPAYSEIWGWQIVPNNMNSEPLYGEAGYGNFYNAYTWSMAVYDQRLYVGTFDWSYLSTEGFDTLLSLLLGLPPDFDWTPLFPPPGAFGADLYRFWSSSSPGVAVSMDGVGNYANYGIRNMVGGPELYLGTSNPMNLMTDLGDDKPEGGWEFRRLIPRPYQIYLPLVAN